MYTIYSPVNCQRYIYFIVISLVGSLTVYWYKVLDEGANILYDMVVMVAFLVHIAILGNKILVWSKHFF